MINSEWPVEVGGFILDTLPSGRSNSYLMGITQPKSFRFVSTVLLFLNIRVVRGILSAPAHTC
jgi:hypothetical protein